ncbi:winged helix-turn-helix transcriptional regulator [Streptomyces sp. NPDC058086]|uniref:winged helix-turn-helix transcriptional regulator n=1 Tax=Streptomyces sp. NPDC058086 TaxID=3346334 RepID=UPI0036EDD36A
MERVILHTLATRPARYGELLAAICPISTKMPAGRLRELEEVAASFADTPRCRRALTVSGPGGIA